jgi:hypothetical protein
MFEYIIIEMASGAIKICCSLDEIDRMPKNVAVKRIIWQRIRKRAAVA